MKPTDCTIIGLTGGIASGKSTVSSILVKKGYHIIDADDIARKVIEINSPAYKKIIREFTGSILEEDKTINRKKLGQIVFSNKELLEILNNITHPYIFEEIKNQINMHCKNKKTIFIDIPLLFELYSGLKKHNIIFNEIWLVYVDEESQLKRLMKRDKHGLEEAMKRINAQMPMKEKAKRATRIIDNRGSIPDLTKSIDLALKNSP